MPIVLPFLKGVSACPTTFSTGESWLNPDPWPEFGLYPLISYQVWLVGNFIIGCNSNYLIIDIVNPQSFSSYSLKENNGH